MRLKCDDVCGLPFQRKKTPPQSKVIHQRSCPKTILFARVHHKFSGLSGMSLRGLG